MEDDFDLEALRLKKLLEDNILKVEKENLELIQNSNLDSYQCSKNVQAPRKEVSTSSSSIVASRTRRQIYNAKSAPNNTEVKSHPQSTQCLKHSNPRIDGKSAHANVHFLNDMQSSMLFSSMKKRILQNEVKSRYTPCAVPLSPPIRIRKEDNVSFSDQTPLLNIHNSNHVGHTVLKKKLTIQNLPGVTIIDEHRSNENPESPLPSRKFSPLVKDFHQNVSDSFSKSPAPSEKISSVKIMKDYFQNASDNLSKVRFETSENSSAFKSIDSSSSPSKSINGERVNKSHVRISQPAAEEHASNISINEQKSPDGNGNRGFNLHISLDSIFTKDVINQFLQKIPDLINGPSTSNPSSTKSSSTKEKIYEDKSQFEFETQSNATKDFKGYASQNYCVSASTQTDVVEKFQNQLELRDLVKEVVLDTLKDMKLPEHILSQKVLSTYQKIDSGIQSEIETDVPDSEKNFQLQYLGNGVLLNKQNVSPLEHKGIQVSVIPIQILEDHSTYDENCTKEISDSSTKHSDDNMMPERTFLSHEPQKVELMLEKIYEHVCQEKELPYNCPGISQSCSIVTRDVAVQFNPLHTSTKSTLTSEIKRVDSSCQYDIPLEGISGPKSYTNTFVQATSFVELSSNHNDLQINAYTQCEAKTFLDTDVQTEMMNSEYSATNTSVSSTPVSDSMFMDDLLSEGEVSLPWNLRLLSLSDRGGASNLNTADSSDISTKEKDYSLSEGEIHPTIVHYFNVCQNNKFEENDLHHEVYSSRQMMDPKLQSTSKGVHQNYPGYNLMCNSNMHHQLTSSLSDGEINSNTSLSIGEIPPGFIIPLAESSHISDEVFSEKDSNSCDKSNYDPSSSMDYTQVRNILPHSLSLSNASEKEVRASSMEASSQPFLLQTVHEENHFSAPD